MGEQTQEVGSYEDALPQLPEAITVGGSAGIAAKLRRAIIDGGLWSQRTAAGRA